MAKVVAAVEPPAWALVCFLAQQAGEKALKALVEACELQVPRTHDLTVLVDLLPAAMAGDDIVDEAIRLSEYGVKPRYPVPAFIASAEDAARAIAAAERIVRWSAEQLGVAD